MAGTSVTASIQFRLRGLHRLGRIAQSPMPPCIVASAALLSYRQACCRASRAESIQTRRNRKARMYNLTVFGKLGSVFRRRRL